MFKGQESKFYILHQLIDAGIIFFSWWFAYYIRFSLLPEAEPGLYFDFFQLSMILIAIHLYFFNKNGLYLSQRFTRKRNEITQIFKAEFISLFLFIFFIYFLWPQRVSRVAIGIYFVLSSTLLIIMRITARNYLRSLRRQGKNLRHVILVGSGGQTEQYLQKVFKFKDAGISIIGWIDSNGLAEKYKVPALDLTIAQVKERYRPDAIILGHPGNEAHKTDTILKQEYNDVIPMMVLPDLTYNFIGHSITEFADIPIIVFNKPKLNFLDVILKRIFDFTGALLGLVFLSPLLIVVALLVKLTSRGPVLYGQKRIGLDGKEFTMWKFRSMVVNAEKETGAVWCKEDDNRRTPIGTFLRSTSIDELPQLYNVLIGQMSLVGPRPERGVFVEQFRYKIPSYMLRLKVKAGVTGWAQANGLRGNTDLNKRIEYDIYYIKNWSIWLDIKIIFLTIWRSASDENAY